MSEKNHQDEGEIWRESEREASKKRTGERDRKRDAGQGPSLAVPQKQLGPLLTRRGLI